jgi:hypothetical protein
LICSLLLLFCHKKGIIVNFSDVPAPVKPSVDDGSLAYLFKDYIDDGIRELIVDFGGAVGNEQW